MKKMSGEEYKKKNYQYNINIVNNVYNIILLLIILLIKMQYFKLEMLIM